MDETMFTYFLSAAIFAAVSGLAVLTMKHHAVYEKLFKYLNLALLGVFLGVTVWGVAVSVTFNTLSPFIQGDKTSLARDAADGLSIYFLWPPLIYFSALCVLYFLSWLGGQEKQDKEAKPRED